MAQLRSYRGKVVDSTEVFGNGNQPSIGNMNVNAQGDLIDENGNVVKTHDQVVREYHTENQKSVVRSSLLDDIEDDFEIDFEPPKKPKTTSSPPKKTTSTDEKVEDKKEEKDG